MGDHSYKKSIMENKNIYEEIYSLKNGKRVRLNSNAICNDEKIVFCIQIPRQKATVEATMIFMDDNNTVCEEHKMIWSSLSHGFDVYEVILDTGKYGKGIFWHDYRLFCGQKNRTINVYDPDDYLRQLLIYSKKFKTPAPIHGTMYHIFVDRFNRSGRSPIKENAILNEDWKNGVPEYAEYPGGYLKNNVFFGGDIYGVTEKLGYISSLGVKYIYLSPIFDSPSNHKYDTADYMTVDEMFGGEVALTELIDKAHEHGIGIILDGVFNHTGDDSVYFNKYGNYGTGGAYRSKRSKYHSWYTFRDYDGNRNDYECWWNIDILPRVNCDSNSYRRFILCKNGVIEKWFSMGISGIRLDVADELSDDFLKKLRYKVKKENPDAIIIGEVWEDASNKVSYDKRREYLHGSSLDSVMNYPLRDAIISYIKHGNHSYFVRTVNSIYKHYPKESADCLMNILGTHDTARIITALADNDGHDLSNAEKAQKRLTDTKREYGIKLLKLAYLTLVFFPGIPCVFYGDEIGTEGYSDPFCRKTFDWEQTNPDDGDGSTLALLDFYREIGKIRKQETLLFSGYVKILLCNSSFVVIMRYDDKGSAIIAIINRDLSDKKLYTDCELTNIMSGITERDPIIPSLCGKYFRVNKADVGPENFVFEVI